MSPAKGNPASRGGQRGSIGFAPGDVKAEQEREAPECIESPAGLGTDEGRAMDNETRFYLRRSRWLQKLLSDRNLNPLAARIGALMALQTSPSSQTVTTGHTTLATWAGLTGKNRRGTAGDYVRQLVELGYWHCLRPGGYNQKTGETWTGAHKINMEIADSFQLQREGGPLAEGGGPLEKGTNGSLGGGRGSLENPHESEWKEEGASPPSVNSGRLAPHSDFDNLIALCGGRLGGHYDAGRAFERYQLALGIYSVEALAEKYKAQLDDDKRKGPGFATYPEKFLIEVCERRTINGSASTPGPSSPAPAKSTKDMDKADPRRLTDRSLIRPPVDVEGNPVSFFADCMDVVEEIVALGVVGYSSESDFVEGYVSAIWVGENGGRPVPSPRDHLRFILGSIKRGLEEEEEEEEPEEEETD